MKFLEILRNKKWLVIGIAAVCALLILAACLLLIPGDDKPTGGTVTPGETVTVTVKNRAGNPLKNVQVYIYGDTALTDLVNFGKTDAEGAMSFVSTKETHVAVLKNLAPGYKVEESYPLDGANTTIVLDALAATADGKLPSDTRFAVGDPMVDFTITDIDGNTYTASEVLQEKKALVLNFWYTACQPCQMEFPYLQKAYDTYKNDLLVLALDPYTADTADDIKAFRTANNLTLPMVAADTVWASAMNIQAYPTTVVIDRYGMIVNCHIGAITEEGKFEEMFAQYVGADYNPAPEEGGSDSTTDGNGGGTTTTAPTGLQTEFTGVLGTKDAPLEVSSTLRFTTEIPAGKESYFHVYRVGGTILTIRSKTAAVVYDGTTYTPKNGKIEIPVQTEDVKIPIEIVLRNTGSATETYTVDFIYPAGSLANPIALKMGELSTVLKEGNDQGMVYTYTAPSNGIVEMVAVSAPSGVDYDFVLYNLNTYANRTLKEDGETKKVSIAMNKGDVLQVTVGVLPNKENKYPAATIKSQLTFTPTEAGVTKPTLPSTVTYSATVKDDKGVAMSGVTLKFEVTVDGTTDTKTVLTDDNGNASAVLTYGNGKVTITLPSGNYVTNKLSYNLTPETPSAVFVLEEDSWFDEPDEPEQPDQPVDPENPENPEQPEQPDEPVDSRVEYTVTLVGDADASCEGITVEFYNTANELLEQQVTDANGTVTVLLEKGNYILKLSGTELKYDERAAVMTASKTTLELLIAPAIDTSVYYTVSDPLADYADKNAYYLNSGNTYVELTPGERNYFLFEPVEPGTYRFTTVNNKALVGYYGSPYFVQSMHVGTEIVNNAFTMSVYEVGPTYVIAVDAPSNVSGTILYVTRIGDADWNPDYEPWVDYVGTHVPTKFSLPAGTELVNVDITAASQEVVYNPADGYYHLNSIDGPVVYLRFSGSPYVNLSDIVANQRVGAYLYDTNGDFLKKEQYNACLEQYYYVPNPMYDPTGTPVNMLDAATLVYPLNADLLYILQSFSAHQQWENPDSPNYLFKDSDGNILPGINNDLAWMFPLCYAE